MFFFIADTHFGHNAIIDLCHRPFKCVEEMDGYMIERWNKKVSPGDTVYIIGDLFYKHKEPEKVRKRKYQCQCFLGYKEAYAKRNLCLPL